MTGPGRGGPDADRDWSSALDRLEADVERIAEALAAGLEPRCDDWEVPRLATPLPAPLRQRASAILGRQRSLLTAVTAAADRSARHHQLAARLDSGSRDASASVYLDVRA
jgi:hypothetical protein